MKFNREEAGKIRPEKKTITNTSSEDIHLQRRESNQGRPQYKLGVQTTEPLYFVTFKDSR